MKILVADDDPIVMHLLKKTLTGWGYEVVCCTNGAEAMQRLLEDRIKIAILDWEMPGMNGPDVVKNVRLVPGFNTYLILLSARNTQTDVIAGLEAGADDFIRKPFDSPELRARLKTGSRIIELEESLKEQAIRDALTGLYNRRYMEETLNREFQRAQRKGTQIGLILADIDHFKKINDTYGHQGGDYILNLLGTFLLENIRSGDVACRYGGEEFLLILSESPTESTVARAEQIRKKLSEREIQFQGKSIGPITISAGVSTFPQHGDTSEDLLQKADAALYEAKARGRNRVVISGEQSI